MHSDGDPVHTREFEREDLEAINELLATHKPWTEYDTGFELDLETIGETGTMQVATVDGSFAGVIWWLPRGAFDRSGYIKLVGVHRDFQSAGVGTRLMNLAESAVSEGGLSDMFLLVSAFNDDARNVYERRGYAEVGRLEGYVEDTIDEVLMRKSIDPP